MSRLLQDDDGRASTSRLISLLGTIVGLIMSLSGCVALLCGAPEGVTLASIGAALYGSAAGTKIFTKFAERK